VHDFTGTGSTKQLITRYVNGVAYSLAGRDELVKLMPAIRGKFPSFASFGASRLEDIFDAAELAKAEVKAVTTFASAIALNDGNGRFSLRPLPVEAQTSMTFATLVHDVNGDGHPDLLVAGNQYGVPPVLGRYDASRGVLLLGDGTGAFRPAPVAESLPIDGQVRALGLVRRPGATPWVAVARNGEALQLLSFPRTTPQTHAR
jgi:hypothetical protein